MKLLRWIESHPLAIITIFLGLRDIVFGYMLATQDPFITNSNVFQNLDALGAIPQFGIAMGILGILSVLWAIKQKPRLVAWVTGITAYGWSFCMMGMFIAGQITLALLYLTAYVGLTAFVGYRWKYIGKNGLPLPTGPTMGEGQ
jgi:hypothetical protein